MMRLTTAALAVLLAFASVPSAAGDFLTKQRRGARVEAAWKTHHGDVRARFRAAGAAWPPSGLFLRGFKAEAELELWAAPAEGQRQRLVRVRTFPICASSGVLGPKARAGDGQVPEGFYVIDRFNPWSNFHLSLGLDYPNAVDRARAAGAAPGGDIFIHGSCVTIGCIPLEDAPVAWLYLALTLARDAGQRALPVHVFPCRFEQAACAKALSAAAAAEPGLAEFWATLRTGYDAFARDGRPPRVKTSASGYTFTTPR